MTKVAKIYLISKVTDKNDKEIKYEDICKILWNLQKDTRLIKNKVIQLCWEWMNYSSDYKEKNEDYPKEKEVLGKTLDGYLYEKLKNCSLLTSSNLNATIRDVSSRFKKNKKSILKGEMSIMSYKSNQPLELYNKNIRLKYEKGEFYVYLSLLNSEGQANYNIKLFRFECLVKDKSTKQILERCYDEIYKISASKLIWDKKKRMWKLNLAFTFENIPNTANLNEERILGTNLGVIQPIVASVYGDTKRLTIEKNEIEVFRKKHENRKRSLQKATKHSGNGKIGHGTVCRTKAVYQAEDKIARFRDTTNFKYANAVVKYAKRNNCGKIAIENLTSVSEKNPYLKNWSYYDLQTKITNKAKEEGIEVISINPAYLSQRCSQCGCINKENHNAYLFKCINCGFEEDADYNASQNCATPDIEEHIKAYCKKYNMPYFKK